MSCVGGHLGFLIDIKILPFYRIIHVTFVPVWLPNGSEVPEKNYLKGKFPMSPLLNLSCGGCYLRFSNKTCKERPKDYAIIQLVCEKMELHWSNSNGEYPNETKITKDA